MTVQKVIAGIFSPLTNPHGITGQSAMGIPPSTDDSDPDRIRVLIDGAEITRAYDRTVDDEIVTPPSGGATWDSIVGTWDDLTDTWDTI